MHQNSPIALVGCPKRDVGPVESCLADSGLNLRSTGAIENGDRVVFCISAYYGPTDGTRKSIESLCGKSVVPIGIVLTYADMVDDDSLRELVNVEERELLLRILPEDVVDDLPLLLDLDPNLANRLADLARNSTSEVRCVQEPQ